MRPQHTLFSATLIVALCVPSYTLEVRVPRVTKPESKLEVIAKNTTISRSESPPEGTEFESSTSEATKQSNITTLPPAQLNVATIMSAGSASTQNNIQTETAATFPLTSKPAISLVLDVTKRDIGISVTELPQTTSSRLFKTTVESVVFNVNDFNFGLKCGRRPLHQKTRNRIKRIVGGSSATEGEWPWQVIVKEVKYLGTIADYKCGGVLISERHALTAAHCKPRAFLSTLVAILGQHRLHEKDLQTIPVTRMIVHKNFNEADFDNDLAVLELKFPVDFSDKVVPICLPDLDENFVGQNGFVTGWGKLAHKGGLPKILQNVKLPIISREKCQQMFMKSGHVKKIHEYFLCAGYDEGKLDACEGDSGGPLSVQRPNGQWVLAGTVSHGIRCAEPNLPGVYMNISYYRPWIERMMALPRMLRSPQESDQRWFRPLWSVVDFYKKRKAAIAYISK
ncbi:trypsin-1-like isoform X2 [Varroa jacobsoni]|uniref:Peptidase S1 domain-containing protein n=1 Tax=Varroa destructor TaxID=109461 RepID=A0A7M7JYA3_VARDE|nr:trypsin-1-like isoform X2 [Varroa destructor]XP_022701280.1 trypsin-1-like isoform X2 [Varroa jacobsoni]